MEKESKWQEELPVYSLVDMWTGSLTLGNVRATGKVADRVTVRVRVTVKVTDRVTAKVADRVGASYTIATDSTICLLMMCIIFTNLPCSFVGEPFQIPLSQSLHLSI